MSRPALRIEYPLTPEQCIAAGRLTEVRAARLWVDDLLRPHGLETLDAGLGGPGDEDALVWATVPNPKGWTLVLSPVAERTAPDSELLALPDGARLEALGWEAEQDEPVLAVAGDDLPRTAAALVTPWWAERPAAGTIRRRPSVDPPDAPSSGSGALHPELVVVSEASLYAARLEQEARTVRAAVARAVADAEVRDAEYATALRALAERMEGEAAGATVVAADLIMEGQARVTSACEVGLDGEGWALTADPAPSE